MFSFKSLFVPKTNEVKEVQVVQLWYVKWTRVYNYASYHYRCEAVMEAFTSKEAAEEFAKSLKAAMVLLKDEIRDITVEKN